MSQRKWVPVASSQEKAWRVAARMLRGRVKRVADLLPVAAQGPSDNLESVHQLRIWSRRAEAALKLCQPLLRRRNLRNLAKQLKSLRRAAGPARDTDVLQQRAAGLKAGLARDHLHKLLAERWQAAQPALAEANEQLEEGEKLRRRLRRLLRRLRRSHGGVDGKQSIRRWARRRLRSLIKKFERSGRQDLNELDQLHKFRIAGKRLKYALELVGMAFGKRLRKRLYARLDRLQTALGAINDMRNFGVVLDEVWRKATSRPLKTQLNRLRLAEQRRLRAALETWLAAWTTPRLRRLAKQLQRA